MQYRGIPFEKDIYKKEISYDISQGGQLLYLKRFLSKDDQSMMSFVFGDLIIDQTMDN